MAGTNLVYSVLDHMGIPINRSNPAIIHIQISREELERRRRILEDQGVALKGDEGTVNYKGVGIAFSYDGTNDLVLTVEHHPFYEPESLIESKIREWFEQEQ